MNQSEAAYLDVIALEQVQVRFVLTWFLTDQSQDGVEGADVHHSLAVLDGFDWEVLQLALKGSMMGNTTQHFSGVLQRTV